MTQQRAEAEDDSRIANAPVAHLKTLTRDLPVPEQQELVRQMRRFLYRETFDRPRTAEPTVALARFPNGGVVPADVRWLADVIEAGELSLTAEAVLANELYLRVGSAARPTDTYLVDIDEEVMEEFLAAPFVPRRVQALYENRSGRLLAPPSAVRPAVAHDHVVKP